MRKWAFKWIVLGVVLNVLILGGIYKIQKTSRLKDTLPIPTLIWKQQYGDSFESRQNFAIAVIFQELNKKAIAEKEVPDVEPTTTNP